MPELCDCMVVDEQGNTQLCGELADWFADTGLYCAQHKHRLHADGAARFRRLRTQNADRG